MRPIPYLRTALFAAVASLAAIVGFDRALAVAIAPVDDVARRVTGPAMTVLEWATLLPMTKFALGFLLLAAGLVLAWRTPTRDLGRFLGIVGGIHMVSRLLSGVLKPPLGRLRPYEMLASPGQADQWFADGNSFPSGHTAHFWALLFPIAWRWPRTRLPLLAVSTFVAASRVAVNDHYLGDVLASISIAAFVSAAFLTWWERRIAPR